MTKPKVFIACDTTSAKKIERIIKESQNLKFNIGYKFGSSITIYCLCKYEILADLVWQF